ncbi:MAG: DUF2306 domain-containing protein [Saprospiraceae bacterium]|nr:DUF2306 domain-containing protein [Saprospiraceae bacterium]
MGAKKVVWFAGTMIYCFFCWLMLRITLQYIPIDTDVAFLRIKQEYIGMWHYRVAFFAHVFAAILALMAGFTQFSTLLRRQYPDLHRWSGWLYAANVLFVAGPSGLVIGIYANGGWSSQLAFCLLAILWMGFTGMAVWSIRRGDVAAHRRWMIRSFALTLSAITLRAWKFAIVAAFEPRPMEVYRVVAWLGWVLNLAVAEWWISRRRARQ